MNNNLINLIKTRRSIRKWKNKKVSDQLIKKIIDCGRHAPSSFDSQPWEFIVIKKKQKIEKLLSDRLQMKKPPHDINSRKYAEKEGLEKYQKVSPPSALIVLCGLKKDCPYLGSLLCSLSCCAENMLLAAHALKLSSCWLYVYDPDTPKTERKIKKILNLSNDHLVLCLLPVGYKDTEPLPRKLKKSKIYWI